MTGFLSNMATEVHGGQRVHDDNLISYGGGGSPQSTDWKEKYYEVSDMLAEARAELDDFQHSSKELEEELERELDRTEKSHQELKQKVALAESQCAEWKNKYVSLQTSYNTTTASLQRELDNLRKDHQQLKSQLRELEMGNDDLERNERAVSSSLADIEAKYSRTLEEKILLEHELLDKANIEEESQRMKDELRDAGLEVNVLTEQLQQAQAQIAQLSASITASNLHKSTASISSRHKRLPSRPQLSNLMEISRPRSPSSVSSSSTAQSMDADATIRQPSSPTRLHRPPQIPEKDLLSSSIASSAHLPNVHLMLNQSSSSTLRLSSRLPSMTRTGSMDKASIAPSTISDGSSAPRSKGVQMVHEIRARVRNLEQKLTARGPRLRTGSFLGRSQSVKDTPTQSVTNAFRFPRSSTDSVRTSTSFRGSTSSKTSLSSRTSLSSKANSLDIPETDQKVPKGRPVSMEMSTPNAKAGSDNSGWVLIMDDVGTPSPLQDKDRERPRSLSAYDKPLSPLSFKSNLQFSKLPHSPTTRNISQPKAMAATASGSSIAVRPPQPRRLSVEGPGNSPHVRSSTPTFIPAPTAALLSSGGNGVARPQKRSSLGSGVPQPKRSSLGAPGAAAATGTHPSAKSSPSPSSYLTAPDNNRPLSAQSHRSDLSRSAFSSSMSVQPGYASARGGGQNGTHTHLKGPAAKNPLVQSRIGKPASAGSAASAMRGGVNGGWR